MKKPRISVIMPAYNAERFIAEGIQSLLAEREVDLEAIVVSDGSTDGTAALVADLATDEPRIRLLEEPHRGVAAARNTGLAAATAPLISFLDSDDISAAGRLKRQSDYLAAHPETAYVVGDLMLVREIGPDFLPVPGTPQRQTTGVSLTTCLFRRGLFTTFGGFDETLEFGEDMDFFMRLWELSVPQHFERTTAVFYRQHDTNMTRDKNSMARFMLKVLHNSLRRRRGRTTPFVLPPLFEERQRAEAAIDNA